MAILRPNGSGVLIVTRVPFSDAGSDGEATPASRKIVCSCARFMVIATASARDDQRHRIGTCVRKLDSESSKLTRRMRGRSGLIWLIKRDIRGVGDHTADCILQSPSRRDPKNRESSR